MIYKVGWSDQLRTYTSLVEVVEGFPEIFCAADHIDDEGEVVAIPISNPTEQLLLEKVEMVNGEGNYHEFIFRPAFEFEVSNYQENEGD